METVNELRAGEFFGTQEECAAYMAEHYADEMAAWEEECEEAMTRHP